MAVLVIHFQLNGISDAEYRAMVESVAPVFTTVPGLTSKIFLTDEVNNTYGGVYLFESRLAVDAYLSSEIVAGLRANPGISGVTAKVFDVIEGATAITQGSLPAVPIAALV